MYCSDCFLLIIPLAVLPPFSLVLSTFIYFYPREEVQRALGPNERALIAASTAAGPDATPFGPTYVYGYPSVAFEVLRSGRIAAVTLFEGGVVAGGKDGVLVEGSG